LPVQLAVELAVVVYGQDVALERKQTDIEHGEGLGNDNLDGANGV
jgi:hypothetical protein